MTRHFVIPDTQIKPNQNYDHLRWAGLYAAEKKPEVIIHIGDHWDMESLSSFDKGTKSYEGRRYIADVEAGIDAMKVFLKPIKDEQKRLKRNKDKQWRPKMVFTLGNHENRINRAANSDPMLDGLIGTDDLQLQKMGWRVIPFLQPVVLDGVVYAHYHCSGIMGRPVSSAQLMLNKLHQSTVMGHVQDRQIAFAKRADGKRMTGIFAGIYYIEDQEYLNPQTNNSWRGCWMLNEVNEGEFDEMPLSLHWLKTQYEGK